MDTNGFEPGTDDNPADIWGHLFTEGLSEAEAEWNDDWIKHTNDESFETEQQASSAMFEQWYLDMLRREADRPAFEDRHPDLPPLEDDWDLALYDDVEEWDVN